VVPLISSVPTLEEMTKAALNVLDDDPDGLFLMVEGGAVDWASHANQSGRMIEEQIDFNNAVQAVMDWIKANSSWGETLLIVTGDHETGYLTGPDSDPTWKPIVNHGAGNLPGMQWNSGSHTNQLIPFFAKGCGAQLFKKGPTSEDPIRGIYIDNTVIADVIFEMLDDK
ncbi:MAG: alkaline phosphatase, partial [Desulfobacterales bacterium]